MCDVFVGHLGAIYELYGVISASARERRRSGSSSAPDVCIVTTHNQLFGEHEPPMCYPNGLAVVDQAQLQSAQLPSAEDQDDPEATAQVRALERECGRYFSRMSSDGRGFLPNAATAARFVAARFFE